MLNVVWILLAGWWLAIVHVVTAVVQAITIIGIPLAVANLKMVPISLVPYGKQIVRTDSLPPEPATGCTRSDAADARRVSRAGAPGASRTASRTTRIARSERVALAREHPGEPPGLHHGLEPAHRPHLLRDQLAGAVLLVVRVDLVERGLRGLVVDALAAQLLGQGPAGQAAAGLLGAHEHARRRRRRRPARPPPSGRARRRRRRRGSPCGAAPARAGHGCVARR